MRRFIRTYGTMTLVVVALALIMSIFEFLQILNLLWITAEHPPIHDLLAVSVLPWLLWVLVAPLIAFTGLRFRPGMSSWSKILLLHISIASLMGVATTVVRIHVSPVVIGTEHLHSTPFEDLVDQLPSGTVSVEISNVDQQDHPLELTEQEIKLLQSEVSALLAPASNAWSLGLFATGAITYVVFAVVVMVLQLHRDVRERQAATIRLENQLGLAQLAALRMQVRPHFLFNTLNSIATLMPRDTEGAQRMVYQLADLLRVSFSDPKTHETPLQKDIELLRHYLDIQQVRFGEKLQVDIHIEPDVCDALVPMFCLQPLVENAIVHGVGARPELGSITIRAYSNDGDVVIEITDNGPGANDEELFGKGVGLRNTRDRLTQMYGKQAQMIIASRTGEGFTVCLHIPYHETFIDVTEM